MQTKLKLPRLGPKIIGYLVMDGTRFTRPIFAGVGVVLDCADIPYQFETRRQANRAIDRTARAAKSVARSMLSDWDRLKFLTEPRAFTIVPVHGSKPQKPHPMRPRKPSTPSTK